MKKQYWVLLAAMALLIAGCGGGAAGTEATAEAEAADDQIAFGSETPSDDETDTDDEPTEGGEQQAASDSETDDPATETEPMFGESTSGTLRSVLLANTLDADDELSSARFEGTMTMVGAPGSGLEGELSIVFSGGYDLANNASEVNMDLSGVMAAAAAASADDPDMAGFEMFAGLFEDPMRLIVIDDRSWMKWGLISLLTGAGDKWIEGESNQASDMTTGFGFGGNGSPTDMLDLLADADATVVEIGQEELRGVTTTHYRAVVDTASLAAGLSADEAADLAAELGSGSIAEVPIEVWIDADGLLHRYVLDLTEAALAQEGDAEVAGATFVFEMWDHGADLGIAPPPAEEVLSADELGFELSDLGSLAG